MPATSLSSPIGIDDQEKLLQDSLAVVKSQAFQMKRCLDKAKLMDALKNASIMLSELRTSQLMPKTYYELYMAVTDELRHLELYLLDEFEKSRQIEDLYELVQYAGNIVPRIYLLITVGIVYIKHNTSLRRSILRDLVEMCRGVQHPLRGLFLRNYLLQSTRNILPDVPDSTPSDENGENEAPSDGAEDNLLCCEGTVTDSMEFVLLNFAEMNKLWVRMQHQGHTRDKHQREREREELRILVGTNLVRLSQLDSVTLDKYQRVVLPTILEQIVCCRDAIAQEYLMECIIQVFPDEFHIETLHAFLKSCAELEAGVNVKNIVISLMDRLAIFKQKTDATFSVTVTADAPASHHQKGGDCDQQPSNEFFDNIQLFELFQSQVALITTNRSDLSPEAIISLHIALINLALKCYPNRVDYVDKVILSSVEVFQKLGISRVENSSIVARELQKLLKIPVDHYNSILTVIQLQHYAELMLHLDYSDRKLLSIYILNNILENDTVIPTQEQAEHTLSLLTTLIMDQSDQPLAIADVDPEEIAEDQFLLARLIHQFRGGTSLDAHYLNLIAVRRFFAQGGLHRVRYVYPTLVFQALQLVRNYHQIAASSENTDEKWRRKCQKVFQFCHSTIQTLVKAELAEVSLRLFLQAALAVDRTRSDSYETIAYEFISQAISLYEDEICESRAQLAAITLIIGTLQQMHCFNADNMEPLRTQCLLAAAKLLKKADQCRGVAICSHLFWPTISGDQEEEDTSSSDTKRAMDCLKKGVKIANQCMDQSVQAQLFVELLNHYVYYFERRCPPVTVEILNELIRLLKDKLAMLNTGANCGGPDESEQIVVHFRNTMYHLKLRRTSGTPPNGEEVVNYDGIDFNERDSVIQPSTMTTTATDPADSYGLDEDDLDK